MKEGDNLWSIAQLFSVPVAELYSRNDLTKDSLLQPGDTLKVFLREEP